MKNNILIWAIAFVLISQVAIAHNISTETLYAADSLLCKNGIMNTTVFAINVKNNLEFKLYNVKAELMVPDAMPPLTSKVFDIGDLDAHEISSKFPNWVIGCDSNKPGKYTVYVRYTNDNGITEDSKGDATFDIEVWSEPPSIVSSSPFGYLNTGVVVLNVTTNQNTVCRFSTIDKAFDSMTNDFIGTGTEHYYVTTVVDGAYIYYVRCRNEKNVTMSSSHGISFYIDTGKPTITYAGPTGLLSTNEITLNATTSENTECRFDSSESEYDSMGATMAGAEKSHSMKLMLGDGTHNYFIGCKDRAGNKVYTTVSFIIDIPPTATISIDKGTTLTSGIAEVSLTTNKDVLYTPTLEYSYSDSPGTLKSVPLEGLGTSWKGFMIIESKDDNKIGSFSFKGTDRLGITGNVIKEGKLFVVDTINPSVPDSLTGEIEDDNTIKLNWRYSGDDAAGFNIYRAESTYVSYGNFYGSSADNTFKDHNVESEKTYYYKISAVDKAGNEGDLSAEIAVKMKTMEIYETNNTSTTPSEAPDEFEKQLSEIEQYRLDAFAAVQNFKSFEQEKKDVVYSTQLMEKAEKGLADLSELRNQTLELLEKRLSNEELGKSLNIINLKMKKIIKTTPKDIEMAEKSTSVNFAQKEDIAEIVDIVLDNASIRDKTIDEVYALQNGINITNRISLMRVTTLDSTAEQIVLVEKEVLFDKRLDGLILVEKIPKSVAEDIGEVIILNKDYTILKRDPVVKFVSEGSDFKIRYMINDVTLEDAKKVLTVPMLSEKQRNDAGVRAAIKESYGGLPEQREKSDFITAYVFAKPGEGIGILNIILLTVGIVVLLGLGVYYVAYVEKLDFSSILPRFKKKQFSEEEFQKHMQAIESSFEEPERSFDEIDYLIGKASAYVKFNNYELAEKTYSKIKECYLKLDNGKKSEIMEKTVKLVSDINILFMRKLLMDAEHHCSLGEIKEAARIYEKIRKSYHLLPEEQKSFALKKSIELHKKMTAAKNRGIK
ncbi:hypothetical protein JXA85_01015 [Candidatus Woesearchaeota archaeon]|nr:hypothetical protein [Candidatus Woesearchaeota archaeon]